MNDSIFEIDVDPAHRTYAHDAVMLDSAEVERFEHTRLQDGAPAPPVQVARRTLEDPDVPAHGTQSRGREETAERASDDDGLGWPTGRHSNSRCC